jgi:hypothetical protein
MGVVKQIEQNLRLSRVAAHPLQELLVEGQSTFLTQ